MLRSFIILVISLNFRLVAQTINGQIGLLVNIGSHINAFGLTTNIGLQSHFLQINAFQSLKFNLSSHGKRKKFLENRFGFGAVLLGGKKNISPDFHLDGLNHQTNYALALAYNYIFYLDNIGTSQRSGAWALHMNYFSLYFENDVFGGQAKDRFRTGVLQTSYRYKDFKYFVNLYLWTGETKNSIWVKEARKHCPNGFRSLENLPFGKTSHGILSFGFHYNLTYSQIATIKAGIDSEQIRHVVQNRFSHDLPFFPKSFERNTPHYPRLNSEGLPVFDKKTRKKDRFYFQSSINEVLSN